MQPDLEAVRVDPVLGPHFEKALNSPHWESATADLSFAPDPCEVQIRKFKAGRRVSFSIEFPRTGESKNRRFLVKVWHSKRGETIYERLVEINASIDRDGLGDLRVPRPLFYDPNAHALAYRWMEGAPLSQRLRQGEESNWIDPLINALSSLHAMSLSNLPKRFPRHEIETVARGLEMDVPAEIREKISNRILERLKESLPRPEQAVSLHRDLYDQQALCNGSAKITLIDLDDMAMGDPMLDVGNLMAHLHLIEKNDGTTIEVEKVEEKFLKGYADRMGFDLALIRKSFVWHKTVSLARLATLQFKRGNPDTSRRLLSLAEATLASI